MKKSIFFNSKKIKNNLKKLKQRIINEINKKNLIEVKL